VPYWHHTAPLWLPRDSGGRPHTEAGSSAGCVSTPGLIMATCMSVLSSEYDRVAASALHRAGSHAIPGPQHWQQRVTATRRGRLLHIIMAAVSIVAQLLDAVEVRARA
jgi:hypothetical protein